MSVTAFAIAGSFLFAGVHVLTPVLGRLPERHQARLASASGGVGLTYVCLYLLFELVRDGAREIHELLPIGPEPLETLFLLLLAALATSHMVQVWLQRTMDLRDDHRGYLAFFLVYNVLVGAGLLEEARWGGLNLAFYLAALGLHIAFNDLFLAHAFSGLHDWRSRTLLAAGAPMGCMVTAAIGLPHGLLYAPLAWVAGGTIITVLRRELPDVGTFRSLAFTVGIAVYTALIFATWRF